MDEVQLMDVVNSIQDVFYDRRSSTVAYRAPLIPSLPYELRELPALNVLHFEKNVMARFENFLEDNDVFVLKRCQNLSFVFDKVVS